MNKDNQELANSMSAAPIDQVSAEPRYPLVIRESQGDLADRAEIEIEQEMRQKLDEAHENVERLNLKKNLSFS